MYVICISDSKFLKKGVRYKVVNIDDNTYCLEHHRLKPNEPLSIGWFHKMNFITIEDNREKIIEEILKKDETKE